MEVIKIDVVVWIRIFECDCTFQTKDLVVTLKIDLDGRVPRKNEVWKCEQASRDRVKLSCIAHKAIG